MSNKHHIIQLEGSSVVSILILLNISVLVLISAENGIVAIFKVGLERVLGLTKSDFRWGNPF